MERMSEIVVLFFFNRGLEMFWKPENKTSSTNPLTLGTTFWAVTAGTAVYYS